MRNAFETKKTGIIIIIIIIIMIIIMIIMIMGISYPLSSRSWDRIKEAIYIYIQTGPLSPTNLATSANPGSGSAEAVQLLRFRSPGSVGLCHDGLMVVARRLWWW